MTGRYHPQAHVRTADPVRIVVADLTTANPNVFHELGLRHAVREWSTVLIFAEGGSQFPFDVRHCRLCPISSRPKERPIM